MLEEKARKDRVEWTSDEIDKMAAIVAQMRIKDPFSSAHVLVHKAMQQLPEHRRRTLQTVKQVPKLVQEIKRYMQNLGDLAEKGALPPPPPPEPPPPPPKAEEIVAAWPTDQLLLAVFARLGGEVSRLHGRLGSLEDQMKRLMVPAIVPSGVNGTVPTPELQRHQIIPRIAIVGLLGGQQQEIGKEFATRIDLRFLNKDQSQPKFPQCDYIVLVTKFISHYWDNAAMSTLPKDRVIRHRGGMKELAGLLHTLC
jgi:hypothetical protein